MKFKMSNVLICIMTLLMVRPFYVQLFGAINKLWAVATLFMSIISLILVIKTGKIKKIAVILLFFGVYIFATACRDASGLFSSISTVGQALLAFDLGVLYFSKDYKEGIRYYIPKCISFYFYIDFVCILLGVSGRVFHIENTISFLGYDNYAAFYILPLLAVKISMDIREYGEMTYEDWMCWLTCLLGKLATGSYTASLVLILYVLLLWFPQYVSFLKKCIKVVPTLIFVVALFIGIHFLKIQYVLAGLLNSTGKGLTLNSRTIIWKYVVRNLGEVPIWGFGYMKDDFFRVAFKFPYGYQVTHCHNLVLDFYVATGIIGLIIFIAMLVSLKDGHKMMKNFSYRALMAGIVSFLILSFFDCYPFLPSFYLMYAVTYGTMKEKKKVE